MVSYKVRYAFTAVSRFIKNMIRGFIGAINVALGKITISFTCSRRFCSSWQKRSISIREFDRSIIEVTLTRVYFRLECNVCNESDTYYTSTRLRKYIGKHRDESLPVFKDRGDGEWRSSRA